MYKARVSFGGLVSMRRGEVRDISDKELVRDLLSANYIEEVKSSKTSNAKKKTDKVEKE